MRWFESSRPCQFRNFSCLSVSALRRRLCRTGNFFAPSRRSELHLEQFPALRGREEQGENRRSEALCSISSSCAPLQNPQILKKEGMEQVKSSPKAWMEQSGISSDDDPVAQPAEQLPFKQWVRGSNPRRVTKNPQNLYGSGGSLCLVVICFVSNRKTNGFLAGASSLARSKPLPYS